MVHRWFFGAAKKVVGAGLKYFAGIATVPGTTSVVPGKTDMKYSFGRNGIGLGVPACPTGFTWQEALTRSDVGKCVSPTPGIKGKAQRFFPGGKTGYDPAEYGEAVMGQFGAGMIPATMEGVTRRCPRGAVLATDGLCYNTRDLANKNREWPRGRRPLLTGGEMRAISIASAAAAKFERTQKRLQRMGMIKTPRRIAARRQPVAHRAHAQGTSIINVD
jgi:hypothetical protein